MKRFFTLTLTVLMLTVFICGCRSSKDSNKNRMIAWDMSSLSEPEAVSSFEIPIMMSKSQYDVVNIDLYYKSKTYDSGLYTFIGTDGDKQYFKGYENYINNGAGYGFICSYDTKTEDYEIYEGIHHDMGAYPVMYRGKFYGTLSSRLYSYDLKTREKKELCDSFVDIAFIHDGWVYSDGDRAYCIDTGKVIEIPIKDHLLGVDKNGSIYGLQYNIPEKYLQILIYNPRTEELVEGDKINYCALTVKLQRDSNGDVWLENYKNDDSEEYSLIRVFKSDGGEYAFNGTSRQIANSWYYYKHTSLDGNSCVARLNLETGEHQCCLYMTYNYDFSISPYFWGYLREQN